MGWGIKPDQRHVDLIVEELNLKRANGVTTPGGHELQRKEAENDEELSPNEPTRYRGIVARANYPAADKPYFVCAVRELCRGIAKPIKTHWHKAKRMVRYLVESGRTVKVTSMK